MITVPVCEDCNRGTGDGVDRPMSMDEEYMRTVLTMTEASERHPVAVKVFEDAVSPSFTRRPKMGTSIINTTKVFRAVTKSGLSLPYSRLAFQIDLDRFERVLRKMAKGMFYAFTKCPVPIDASFKITPRLTQEGANATVAAIKPVTNIEPVSMQDGAVVFWGALQTNPPAAIMLFYFYRTWAASVLIEPPQSMENPDPETAEPQPT